VGVSQTTEAEATEYERTLTDEQLVGFSVEISQRVQSILSQGVPLPMQEIENHHIIALLECFIGSEESLRVREFHLSWLDNMLDQVEGQLRARALTMLDHAADLPGFP
jgi:hypothetical protein